MVATANRTYTEFLADKAKMSGGDGFEPLWLPDCLFGFQRCLVEYAIRRGRAAIYADCGLGKSVQQLVWAENVVRQTNGYVLVLTPLAVGQQTEREAAKFGMEAKVSRDGKRPARITITNYERLHHFNPLDFDGVVADESSILKNFDGATKAAVTEFMRTIRYRLLCTATAAPNDYFELGTSSEALGELGYSDMLTRFFKDETKKDYLGWGRKTYRFRGHAERPFWKWVCSWARACRQPSDLGFSNDGFELPPLIEVERCIENSTPRPGMLFSIPARNLREQREERRITLSERCEAAAANVTAHVGPSVVWCHLNPEGDLLEKIIPDAKQVSGSMHDDRKEELLLAFQSGQLERLVIKPRIGCFGLNWQHCHNIVTFASHSWEQYYQSVRRCWRFGQTKPVTVTVITTNGEHRVVENLKRKARQADAMFSSLVALMNESEKIDTSYVFSDRERMPSWR